MRLRIVQAPLLAVLLLSAAAPAQVDGERHAGAATGVQHLPFGDTLVSGTRRSNSTTGPRVSRSSTRRTPSDRRASSLAVPFGFDADATRTA
jgi:hypothetical protein